VSRLGQVDTLVCTGFSPAGYQQYGRRFLETFWRHWPHEIGVVAYTEDPVMMPGAQWQCRSLWDCEGARAFYDRHRQNPEYCGRAATSRWKVKEHRTGYAWRFDAVKFFRQCLIPEHAAGDLADGDILVWLDADVVSFADVPAGLIDELLAGHDLAYLGRRGYHSEIGFWAVRLGGKTRQFLTDFAELYRSDAVFALSEHHSAWAFDHCRRLAERSGLKSRDLTPGGAGHVWFQSPLGLYSDHLKGPQRKLAGTSTERRR
jgi:hypothetical protein